MAHRGASGYAPENTLAAFRLAERMGATEIELDVQFTQDRQLVICHDENLARYGYPDLRVEELNMKELLALDMGSWFSPYLYAGERMLAFDTLLKVFHDHFIYHVEMKNPVKGMPKAVLETLSNRRLQDQAVITSFHFEPLTLVRNLAPNMRLGWLIPPGQFRRTNMERAATAKFFQICPPAKSVNKEAVTTAHRYVPEVRAHSVKGLAEMIQVIEAGCDGLTINWPDWLIHKKGDLP
jgi:glycerophosphoryl diester phosphodiesterase